MYDTEIEKKVVTQKDKQQRKEIFDREKIPTAVYMGCPFFDSQIDLKNNCVYIDHLDQAKEKEDEKKGPSRALSTFEDIVTYITPTLAEEEQSKLRRRDFRPMVLYQENNQFSNRLWESLIINLLLSEGRAMSVAVLNGM